MELSHTSNEDNNEDMSGSVESQKKEPDYWKWVAFGFIALFVFTQFFEVTIRLRYGFGEKGKAQVVQGQGGGDLKDSFLPRDGVRLPVQWGDIGKKMVEAGVIDREKLEAVYEARGGLDEDVRKLLESTDIEDLVMNEENSAVLLNFLWAFGLSNKNRILEEGPMTDARYGGDASRFASTGGWPLAKGNVMDHFSAHAFVTLTPAEQERVERVSQNIYRPCCGNSTYFPDCNHGMAMLGLLELLASRGASEEEMYRIALQVNSYWFPDTYRKKFWARHIQAARDISKF